MYVLGTIPVVISGQKSLPPDIALIPSWATGITSMFLHGGWMHLIGNMFYLWIFGNNVEEAMGHRKFLLFYVVCGFCAMVAHVSSNIHSEIPMVGASGAISGVLGAYLLLYPRARVLVAIPLGIFIHTTRLAAGWVLGFWFILQLVNSLLATGQQGAGIAWGAHVGGFVAGMLLVSLFKKPGVRLFAPPRRRT